MNGIDGETCSDFKSGDSELWCNFVTIPKCADRTIKCSEPPTPEGAVVNYSFKPNRKVVKVFENYDFGKEIIFTGLFYPPASKASREVANLTERKNLCTPIYEVREFVCLSVYLLRILTSIILDW